MKKFALILSLTMTLALSACGGGNVNPENGVSPNGSDAAGLNVTDARSAEDADGNSNGVTGGGENGDTAGGAGGGENGDVAGNASNDPTGGATAAPAADAPVGGGNLTVAVVGEYNDYLKAAIEGYKEINKDASVEITEYSWDIEQYSKSINTAIMSGGGEDIIDVSFITWQKLADKDKLVDLNEYITFTDEEFYLSILDSYLYRGKRYTLPASFNFKALGFMEEHQGKEPAADLNLDTLITLAEKYPDSKLIYSVDIRDAAMLADLIMRLNFNDYIDLENKKADVNNERFISLLNNVMLLSDKIATKPEEDTLLRQYDIWNPEVCGWTIDYTVEGEGITSSSMSGSFDYTDLFLLTNEEGQGVFETSPGLSIMPAINANSEQRGLAADFIKHLFSPAMQTSPEIMFSPVNRKAGTILKDEFIEIYKGHEEELGFDYEKNAEMFDSLVSRLAFGKTNDNFIQGFILDEMNRFFDGEQTAEQAADNLQSKLSMYLNE